MRTGFLPIMILASMLIFGCIGTGVPNTANTTTAVTGANSTGTSTNVMGGPLSTANTFIQSVLYNDPISMASTLSPGAVSDPINFSTELIIHERETRGLVSFAEAGLNIMNGSGGNVIVACLGKNDGYPMVFTLDDEGGQWLITGLTIENDTEAPYCYGGNVTPPTDQVNCTLDPVVTTLIDPAYVAAYSECDCLYEFVNNTSTPVSASNATINSCKETVAIRYQDTAGCSALEGQDVINDCYQQIAMNTGDASYCYDLKAINSSSGEINQSDAQNGCVRSVNTFGTKGAG